LYSGKLLLANCVEKNGNNAARNTYLVCYDIRDDKRLRTVYKTVRDFGNQL
jgi:hypothetical protein